MPEAKFDYSLPDCLEGRDSVRTIMQWDVQKNAGFSDASKDKLVHPVIDSGDYDFRKVNVSRQQKDPDSFMNWMARLISTRKHSPQLSFGECTVVKNNTRSVFSFYNLWEKDVVILLHNLNDQDHKLKLDIGDKKFGSVTEIFSNKNYEDVKKITDKIRISAYGYRWFKCNII